MCFNFTPLCENCQKFNLVFGFSNITIIIFVKYIEICIQFLERCVGIFNYTIRRFDCMLHDLLLLLCLLPMIPLPLIHLDLQRVS